MDAMSLSLDEIIKKKSIGKRTKPGKAGAKKRTGKPTKQGKRAAATETRTRPGGKKVLTSPSRKKKLESLKTRSPIGKPKVVVDARMKIIQKKRAHIRDARDKLIELARNSGDARLRLLKRKGTLPPGSGMPKKRMSGGKLFHEDLAEDFEMKVDLRRPIVPLKRTVRNEMFTVPSTMPPLPTFSRHVRNSPPPQTSSSWSSDPFDCYEVHTSRPTVQKSHAPVPLPQYDDLPPRRSIARARTPPLRPMYADDRPHLSSTMRARLECAPNQSESMGIFAKMPPDDHYHSSNNTSSRQQYSHHHHHQQQPQSPSPSPPISGYRIVVSNLHSSVTQNDIKELFEDIGDLLESRLVRPGVAEVIYRTLKDAEEAVDTYHNRQLDGQPMKCLLVKPRSANKPTAPAISYSSSSRSLKPSSLSSSAAKKSQVEIDIDALHTVLFRRDH
ncbi:polymerase delta-interacting protein 3 [Wyeomyia smithii]|uniref:polymerase delta-interacting protein 3 n=1 Tax=Wyeomyia smithii TaxID=174621 RepID=UPI002467C109|nr:polymerase delta-interacting protein 3 [Wyeomyia smithii]